MLIDREEALETFSAMTKSLNEGFGGILLISGEAGIGKTALVSHCFDQNRDGYCWAWGGCDALYTPRVLGPFYDIATMLNCDFDYLLSQENGRAQVFSNLLNALSQSASPVILVLEDFHWADHASLDLLKFLGRRINFMPVLRVKIFSE